MSGQDSIWLDQVVWTGDSAAVSFQSWANERGLTGDLATLFSADHDADGIPNGMEYAFGSNMTFRIRMMGNEPGVEMTMQDESTTAHVDVNLKATTNLVDWTLDVAEVPGAPAGHKWYAPTNTPDHAFFKVEATLTQ